MPDIFISDKKETKEPDRPKTSVYQGTKKRTDKNVRKKRLERILSKPFVNQVTHKSNNQLSSFCYYPSRVQFVNKDPEEEIIVMLRKHPITNLSWILLAIVMFITPVFMGALPIISWLPDRFQIVTYIFWYLITTAFVFEKFLSWFFQVNIITDERIIDVDFMNLIYREMSDANIDQVQDVTVSIGGAVRTYLNFGNVLVQTAAEIPQIEFDAVSYPDKVAAILRELRVEEEVEKVEGRVR